MSLSIPEFDGNYDTLGLMTTRAFKVKPLVLTPEEWVEADAQANEWLLTERPPVLTDHYGRIMQGFQRQHLGVSFAGSFNLIETLTERLL